MNGIFILNKFYLKDSFNIHKCNSIFFSAWSPGNLVSWHEGPGAFGELPLLLLWHISSWVVIILISSWHLPAGCCTAWSHRYHAASWSASNTLWPVTVAWNSVILVWLLFAASTCSILNVITLFLFFFWIVCLICLLRIAAHDLARELAVLDKILLIHHLILCTSILVHSISLILLLAG